MNINLLIILTLVTSISISANSSQLVTIDHKTAVTCVDQNGNAVLQIENAVARSVALTGKDSSAVNAEATVQIPALSGRVDLVQQFLRHQGYQGGGPLLGLETYFYVSGAGNQSYMYFLSQHVPLDSSSTLLNRIDFKNPEGSIPTTSTIIIPVATCKIKSNQN